MAGMLLRLLSLLFVVTVVSGFAAVEKRPITHEDLWLMKRVAAPEISPDGRLVVFSVTNPAYDAKEQSVDLWLVAADGGTPPRQLTHTKGAESGATWSPDGKRLLFSAKRESDEVAQIYLLDLATGGEAERITNLAMGAKNPKWSPDGSQVLFVSEVFPGALDAAANQAAAKARKERKWNARVYDGFPIRYWDQWLDEKKAHLFVQQVGAGAPARDLFAGTQLAAAPGFGGRETTSGETFSAVWAPDGQSVLFVATTQKHRAAFAEVRTDLFQVPAAGGEPQRLTQDDNSYSSPVFSPDGRGLVVGVNPGGDGKVYHLTRLAGFPWPFVAAARRILTAEFDRDIGAPVFSPDGRTLFFSIEEAGVSRIYRLEAKGGRPVVAFNPPGGMISELSGGGAGERFRLVHVRDSAASPAELATWEPAANAARFLTQFNAGKLAELDLPPVEHFTFTTRDGREVHNLLVRPAQFDAAKKYPVVTIMHGGPHSMAADQWSARWNTHLLAGTEYVLVTTNYLGSTGFGEGVAQGIQGDPLKTPGDDVIAGLEAALARYPFLDGTRLAAAGGSYGGHLANWLQATTTRFKCLISHAGLVNLETQWATSDVIYGRELNNGGPVWEQGGVWREQNPVRFAGNNARGTGWLTPMLMIVGEQDFRVPLSNTLENWSYHQRLKIPSRLLVFPDENHWILKGENSKFWYAEFRGWLARWLAVPGH
jgi:dipeptidyl aminopeptidase/acylaminoacyl peptidase